MPAARWFPVVLVIGGAACSSFSGAASSAPDADGGIGDASAIDSASDDGGSPADSGAVGPGVISTVADENAATRFVTTDEANVYFWSVARSSIIQAPRDDLAAAHVVFELTGKSLVGLAVDSANAYWIEQGAGTDGSFSNRLVRGPSGGGPQTVVYDTTATLQALALSGSEVAALEASGLDVAPKSGTASNRPLGVTSPLLAGDDTAFYYVFESSLVQLLAGRPATVCTGLAAPAGVVTDASNIYIADARPGGVSLFEIDRTRANPDLTSASPLRTFAESTVYLAIDNLGVVVASAKDGSIVHVASNGASTPVTTATGVLNSIAADSQGVYWATEEGKVMWQAR